MPHRFGLLIFIVLVDQVDEGAADDCAIGEGGYLCYMFGRGESEADDDGDVVRFRIAIDSLN